ncbi:hypothetical protein DFH08DRAFT_967752 [Mycena albidolilacea]|uniref:Uncharacterized protein n=1 Tax=Mycena albidolilacea TaxID=1033008 RepID=A0AAD6ZL16_9AGAR|nr:hypothetical protein DFH08DRAFT_967752 [Mycena albidolilacea]
MPARSPLPAPEIHGGSDMDGPYAGGAGVGGTEPAIADCCVVVSSSLPLPLPPTPLRFHSIWERAKPLGYTQRLHGGQHDRGALQRGRAPPELGFLFCLHPPLFGLCSHCWASTSLDFPEIAAGQGPTPIDASTIVMAFF